MLYSRNVHKFNERICCESYNEFPTLSSIQWACGKFFQIVKNLFYKAKEEGVDINKCLMIYHNTPLTCTPKSPMQMLQQRSARSQLPMSNVARRKFGIIAEQQPKKNQHIPLHDCHIGQDVMCQSPITKKWFPVKIKELCPEPRSYQVEMPEGIIYRRTQNHLKPFTPSERTQINEQCSKLPLNKTLIKSDSTSIEQRPKRQIKVPTKLNL